MAEVVPSIIAKTFEEVKKKIVLLEDLVAWTQLDIMDGNFVLPTSWNVAEDLENVEGKIKIEAHLMVKGPEEILKTWMSFADRLLVHYESTNHLSEILEAFLGAPAQAGVALKIDTPLSVLEEFKNNLNYIQLMSIDRLGYYGAKFDEQIYDRLKEAREMFPEAKIGVDGGINLENAPKLIEAGADRLVVGSAIWESGDIKKAIENFQAL